jgi:hypothetical protein
MCELILWLDAWEPMGAPYEPPPMQVEVARGGDVRDDQRSLSDTPVTPPQSTPLGGYLWQRLGEGVSSITPVEKSPISWFRQQVAVQPRSNPAETHVRQNAGAQHE